MGLFGFGKKKDKPEVTKNDNETCSENTVHNDNGSRGGYSERDNQTTGSNEFDWGSYGSQNHEQSNRGGRPPMGMHGGMHGGRPPHGRPPHGGGMHGGRPPHGDDNNKDRR